MKPEFYLTADGADFRRFILNLRSSAPSAVNGFSTFLSWFHPRFFGSYKL
jgi:hypothetical protein